MKPLLEPEQRFAASIHGKVRKYSQSLRNGLAETLALLGTAPEALKSCSQGKPVATTIRTVREIFKCRLAPMGESQRFASDVIFLPWHPQTCAPIAKRKSALAALLKEPLERESRPSARSR